MHLWYEGGASTVISSEARNLSLSEYYNQS